MARRQLTLDNDVAAELAGSEDSVLRELEERLGCDMFLRGNVLTLDGDETDVGAAAQVDELVGLVERGHELAPTTVDTVAGDRRRPALRGDRRRRHLGAPEHPGSAEDGEPEALRRLDPPAHDHLRDRPRRDRQDLPRGRRRRRRARGKDVNRIILTRPAVEASERLGFLPGDIQAKVDPYLRPLFDALYDMLDPGGLPPISTAT